jgi:uncharacterized protein
VKLKDFTFKLTESCNFDCTYCLQTKSTTCLEHSYIETALDFFFPILEGDCFINFYGGEPLLELDSIRHIVESVERKKKTQHKQIQYTISTNGSLIDDETLRFFSQHLISPLISFDGLAQEITRKMGTYAPTVAIIEKLKAVDIKFTTNSVFTPGTVENILGSMRLLMDLGVKNIDLSFSMVSPWDEPSLQRLEKELERLRPHLVSFYDRHGFIPIQNLSGEPKKRLFYCAAGRDRMTLAPDGKLWGCHVFPLYFSQYPDSPKYQKYCFGDLNDFIENHKSSYPLRLRHHEDLRMDCFCTDEKYCLFCEDLEYCSVCPVYAALGSGVMRRIPTWICRIQKLMRTERALLGEVVSS